MFGIGTTELVVILVVALLVLGPKKLPEIAKSLGKTLAEFKRVSTDVKRTIEMEVDRDEEEQAKKRIKREMAQKSGHYSKPSQPQETYPDVDADNGASHNQNEPQKKDTASQ
ncbi:Sec-independent protein translocase protein TatB [Desulfonatronovibrio magnus]|uniref:Sec-independent protein translocase protein TatB n=1 Tax=Desulfonatronovibrio magnus TaxID=698827 RepID=UPI0005EB93F2|nr:Sec-independent protein translocase protein TatB [Desulfonatronovibrio magnus]